MLKMYDKKLFSILVVISLIVSSSSIAFATSETNIVTPQWAYIDFGESSLTGLGNFQVAAYGSTFAWTKVSYIEVQVNLQMYINGQWSTIETQTYGRYNSSYLTGEFVYTVPYPATYRVFCQHKVTNGGYTETCTSWSGNLIVVE